MKTISYSYNKMGYEVLVWEDGECISEYQAGNHKLESSQKTRDPQWMVSLDKLKEFAAQTAREMAAEHGIPENRIENNGLVEESLT